MRWRAGCIFDLKESDVMYTLKHGQQVVQTLFDSCCCRA
jgi:hypothetical protein